MSLRQLPEWAQRSLWKIVYIQMRFSEVVYAHSLWGIAGIKIVPICDFPHTFFESARSSFDCFIYMLKVVSEF